MEELRMATIKTTQIDARCDPRLVDFFERGTAEKSPDLTATVMLTFKGSPPSALPNGCSVRLRTPRGLVADISPQCLTFLLQLQSLTYIELASELFPETNSLSKGKPAGKLHRRK